MMCISQSCASGSHCVVKSVHCAAEVSSKDAVDEARLQRLLQEVDLGVPGRKSV